MSSVVRRMVAGECLLHNKECVINNILFICEFAKTVYSNETKDYLHLTKKVTESCTDHDLAHQSMVIGTSALAQYKIDGAAGMYSGIFNNPFMIWGKYKRAWCMVQNYSNCFLPVPPYPNEWSACITILGADTERN